MERFHFTQRHSYNNIRSQEVWQFNAHAPPGNHPYGAYFTSLNEYTPKLTQKLRIPRKKTAFFFAFRNVGDLRPLRGGRGQYIFYSPTDYPVDQSRQIRSGQTP